MWRKLIASCVVNAANATVNLVKTWLLFYFDVYITVRRPHENNVRDVTYNVVCALRRLYDSVRPTDHIIHM